MGFSDYLISDSDYADKDIASISGNTVTGQADWLKQRFDSAVKNVVAARHNGLAQALGDVGAAARIGAAPLLPGGAATVGGQLAYLKDELNGVALSQIPDGAVTDEKLSGAPGQVKARLGAVEQDKAPLISPAFAGEPTAPTAAEGDNSEKLANTAYVQGEITPANAHIADGDLHVTAALNQKLAGFEPYQQLWSGSWGSGSITVPGAENYRVFQFELEGTNCPLTVYRCGQWILAGGGSVATQDRVLTSHIYATIANGNQFSLGSCYVMWHNFGSTHGGKGSDSVVSAIYGMM